MTGIRIVINSKEDAAAGTPIVKDLKMEDLRESNDLTIAILQEGMQSGATSLMFLIKNADGTTSMAQTSKALFEQVYAALLGAEQRWESEKKQR